ncbi:hypothetical protein BDV93DRAFT_522184, partial [Ceratobasidium sp. AG-I]
SSLPWCAYTMSLLYINDPSVERVSPAQVPCLLLSQLSPLHTRQLSLIAMQLQSTLSRFAAFVLLMLSFSMLACAAPAPVAAPGALVARGSEVSSTSLVARGDVSDQCHQALLDLDVKLSVDIDLLNKCYDTKDCDCKPIVAQIVAHIQLCIDIIAKLSGTIDVKLSVIVQLIVSIIVVNQALVSSLAPSAFYPRSLTFFRPLRLVLNVTLLLTAHLTALISLLGL